MFFKKMTPSEIKSTQKAGKLAFGFYLVALLAHSIYEFAISFELSASFWILISGLIVFFVSDFIFNQKSGDRHDQTTRD